MDKLLDINAVRAIVPLEQSTIYRKMARGGVA